MAKSNRKQREPNVGFAERLKEAMKRKGVGVAEFAARVPVEPNSVSRWRAGYVPGPVHLRRVAELLDVSTGFLKGDAVSDPEAWPANHSVGSRQDQPSRSDWHQSTGTPDTPSDTSPAADRPVGAPPLPEPIIPESASEWTATLVVYKAALSYLADLDLPPDIRADIRFFFNRLAVASQQDLARVQPVPVPNGEKHAG